MENKKALTLRELANFFDSFDILSKMKLEHKDYGIEKNLNEAAITFGGKSYPKSGEVVLLAGGAGSGKGFILKNLLHIEGKVMDVDRLKELAHASTTLRNTIKKVYPEMDWDNFDWNNPESVHQLHQGIKAISLQNKFKSAFEKAASLLQVKPNLIIDSTLKQFEAFEENTDFLKNVGYDKRNINIVWVLTDLANALKNNSSRGRKVDENIVKSIHVGVSMTMKTIMTINNLHDYMDGDIWICFNGMGDTKFERSDKGNGGYISKGFYVQLKKKGEKPIPLEELEKDILEKIDAYVPVDVKWK